VSTLFISSGTGKSEEPKKIALACSTLLRYNVSQEDIMAATKMVHVRVDEQTKTQAAETLAAIGLSISDAVRVFLMRVVAEKQMPFALKVPNVETSLAMAEADEIERTRRARFNNAAELFDDLEKNTGK